MKKVFKILETPFHPVLFTLFPVLSLFAVNIKELPISEIKFPLTIILLVIIIFWSLLNFVFPDKKLTAIITSLTALFLFSYQPLVGSFLSSEIFFQLIRIFRRLGNINGAYWFTSGIAVLGLIYFLQKSKKHLTEFTIMFNIAALFITIWPLFTVTTTEIIRKTRIVKQPVQISAISNKPTEELPDIYYIIVDAYANQHTLQDYYNFDNSDFVNFLKQTGFYVAQYSKSNYPLTYDSVPSSLNMDYLDELIKQVGKDSTDVLPLQEFAQDNRLILYLKAKGYKYYNFGPKNHFFQIKKNVDFNFTYFSGEQKSLVKLSAFTELFISQTLLKPLIDSNIISLKTTGIQEAGLNDNRSYYNEILNQIDSVPKIAPQSGPKFVFVHSLLTHPPFVFNQEGNFVSNSNWTTDYRKGYIDQLIFANQALQKLIGLILQGSPKPPVIVLQSDHGSYPPGLQKEGYNFYWPAASKDELKERFGILNAYYFPDKDTNSLYETITPVNSFRIILNKYFGEKLKLLPDRSFVPSNFHHPYDVTDVTDLIK
ncbi:sulfatase-like hydrolase/transferase [Candidatus Daviesbacteria bacterium]|nr:sulfatase-like hydrolase/transferase [Candidatus Daviesbacteria bacterium]